MGRHRKDPTVPLPLRVYKHRSNYIYYPKGGGKTINLGSKLSGVGANYARLVLGQTDARLIDEGIGRQLYRRCRGAAKTRGIAFDLTYDDVVTLIKRARGRCELTGIPFDLDWKNEYKRQRRPWFPSIDRVSNAEGYTVANTRLVCVAVNIALSTFGHKVLLTIARAMSSKKVGWHTGLEPVTLGITIQCSAN